MMDKEYAKNKSLAHVLKKYPCVVATNCVVEMVIDEYEKLLKREDDEAWRAEYDAIQATGERFEYLSPILGAWSFGSGQGWNFYAPSATKDQFRLHVKPGQPMSHAAERALYWKQRAEGTNEVWQYDNMGNVWIDILGEPRWLPCCKYRPKPKTRTIFQATVGINVKNFKGGVEEFKGFIKAHGFTIHGHIEEREVECD